MVTLLFLGAMLALQEEVKKIVASLAPAARDRAKARKGAVPDTRGNQPAAELAQVNQSRSAGSAVAAGQEEEADTPRGGRRSSSQPQIDCSRRMCWQHGFVIIFTFELMFRSSNVQCGLLSLWLERI